MPKRSARVARDMLFGRFLEGSSKRYVIVKIHWFTDSHKQMCSTIKRASLLGGQAGWYFDRSSYRETNLNRPCMVDAFYFSGFLCFDEKYILAQISTTK